MIRHLGLIARMQYNFEQWGCEDFQRVRLNEFLPAVDLEIWRDPMLIPPDLAAQVLPPTFTSETVKMKPYLRWFNWRLWIAIGYESKVVAWYLETAVSQEASA